MHYPTRMMVKPGLSKLLEFCWHRLVSQPNAVENAWDEQHLQFSDHIGLFGGAVPQKGVALLGPEPCADAELRWPRRRCEFLHPIGVPRFARMKIVGNKKSNSDIVCAECLTRVSLLLTQPPLTRNELKIPVL